ncbi:Structural maintenance of chromosomes protein 1 [Haplosporangium bisporale]|nr:Structural maintenance of chromosomes protein 1 [Haplosporangium bisporale]
MEAKLDQRESEKEQKFKDTLSSLKRIFPGVHGRVTDLCKPTQRKYDAAISVILGRHMDAIIVDRQKTAIDCIQLLREQRSGHATFLPLDTLSAKPVNDRLRSVAKGARLAVDVVQYDEVLETAIHYVCGNALVCDTMEVARHVCYDLGHQVKAVALDGTVFHKSGLITGGQSGLGSAVRRWDEKVVDDLKRRRDTMLAQLNELSKTKKRGEHGETLRSELAGIESKLAFAREDLSATKRNIGEIREQIQLINAELAEKEPKAEQSARDLTDREVEISRIDAQIHEIEDEVFASLCHRIGVANIREYEELKLKRSQELSEKRSKFETVLSKMRNHLSFETTQLDETKERLSRLENMITTETSTLDEYEARRDEIQAQQAAIQKEMESLKKELDAAQAAFQTRSEKVSACKKQVSQKNKQVDALMKDIGAKIDEIYKSLTRSTAFPMGGTAYLSLEDTEEPYLDGIRYHAMPPLKRFRDMDQLSGGEKTMAALALLFAIHSFRPSPFFVLDEVDAALDNMNVSRIGQYLQDHASANLQFIVISLKSSLYERGQGLVGIYRDQGVNSSKTLTLALDQFQTEE